MKQDLLECKKIIKFYLTRYFLCAIVSRVMTVKRSDKRMAQATTTKRQTTEDKNVTLSVSLPESLLAKVKKRATEEMRPVSSMVAFLLAQALRSTEN